MSRRTSAPTRVILPDPKFGSDMLAKFMNMVMKSGKKSAAEHIMYGAIERITEKTSRQGDAALEVLSHRAREREARGRGEVPPRRRRDLPGAGRGAPRAPADARDALADRGRARAQREVHGAPPRHELMDAAENRGTAVRKREDTHRMAEANKAFAHYRW
jgi:small subunit ribosomal protein S7